MSWYSLFLFLFFLLNDAINGRKISEVTVILITGLACLQAIAIIQSFSWLLPTRILDFATTFFQIKMKEAMYINWEKQTLNQQLELSVSFSLFLVHYIFWHYYFTYFSICIVLSFFLFMSKYHYCRPVLWLYLFTINFHLGE